MFRLGSICSIVNQTVGDFIFEVVDTWKKYTDTKVWRLQNPGIRIQIMKDVCSFLSFKLDVNRLNCVSKSRYSIFERKKQCLKVVPKVVNELLQRDKYFNTSDLYHYGQKKLINKAIQNVNRAIVNRGDISTSILYYVNTTIEINICRDNSF